MLMKKKSIERDPIWKAVGALTISDENASEREDWLLTEEWAGFNSTKSNVFGILKGWKTDPQKLKDKLRGEWE
ncbi:hypothetical protein [Thermococcus gammatolerans]|uniref:hypothetical protein n=1 Tax=Thermococcus gammatolerans TaxID=187878 RepID=UPI00145D75DA|nr:hypothetical protein [Thermococcus gammatolerans]